ncbi:hypothetical protein GCM10027160_22230 [Streptomyces calidiresistens]|uniref:DUF5134 domain-containing protein n=1 Tax=Streptomyces calidiresistens TaxID=1485586 RepID=A0A7W3T6Z8_9ACTN|nr:DUF5134 domain-containing protein [Streptomyces calidiresistens]
MHGAAPVGWLMAVICAGTGLYCLCSARRSTGRARQVAVVEGVMLAGMAVMAVPGGAAPLPSVLLPGGAAGDGLRGAAVLFFPVLALWPLVRPRPGPGHRVHHLVEGAAMGWMVHLWLLGGHTGPSTGPPAVFTALSAAYFAGCALWVGSRLVPPEPTPGPSPGRSPEMAAACRVVTALAMAVMLVGM